MIGSPHRMRPVEMGDTARFECSVRNAAFYRWSVRFASAPSRAVLCSKLIDARLSGADQRILQIARVELDDAGNYTCEAVSGATGQSEPITFELNVYHPRNANASRPDPRLCMCSARSLERSR